MTIDCKIGGIRAVFQMTETAKSHEIGKGDFLGEGRRGLRIFDIFFDHFWSLVLSFLVSLKNLCMWLVADIFWYHNASSFFKYDW